jgi:hypothetical protein
MTYEVIHGNATDTKIQQKISMITAGDKISIYFGELIFNMFNVRDVVSTIKSKRIERLGQIQRMQVDGGVKRISGDKLGGKWRMGRPRPR